MYISLPDLTKQKIITDISKDEYLDSFRSRKLNTAILGHEKLASGFVK